MEKEEKCAKIMEKYTKKDVNQCLGATLKHWLTPKSWSTFGKNVIFFLISRYKL